MIFVAILCFHIYILDTWMSYLKEKMRFSIYWSLIDCFFIFSVVKCKCYFLLLLLFLISFRIIIYCFANTNLYFILTINRHFSPIKHAFFVHFSFHFMISFCLFFMEFENIIKMTKYNKHLTKNKKGEMFSLDTNTINRVWFSENARINGLCLNGSYEWNALNWKWT